MLASPHSAGRAEKCELLVGDISRPLFPLIPFSFCPFANVRAEQLSLSLSLWHWATHLVQVTHSLSGIELDGLMGDLGRKPSFCPLQSALRRPQTPPPFSTISTYLPNSRPRPPPRPIAAASLPSSLPPLAPFLPKISLTYVVSPRLVQGGYSFIFGTSGMERSIVPSFWC